MLKWWSKTQPTIALSSGEAELAAIVKSTSEGLGMIAVMKEYGIECDLVVKSDAVAAIGIVKRQGLGRVRHLAVADLWVQQRAKGGEVNYVKLDGKRNTSDMMTKAVEGEVINRHMQALGLQYRSGRHEATPAYTGGDMEIPGEGAEEAQGETEEERRGGAGNNDDVEGSTVQQLVPPNPNA